MRNYLFIVFIFSLKISTAQFNIKSAGSNSGIITSGNQGLNIGYSFSDSEASFTYSKPKGEGKGFTTYWRMKNGNLKQITDDLNLDEIDRTQIQDTLAFLPFKGNNNIKLSIPVAEGKNTLISGGNFNPGIGIDYEFVRSANEFAYNPVYKFTRLSYEVKENKFGSIDINDSLQINKKASHKFGATFGINKIYGGEKKRDNLILATSVSFEYFVNPVLDLKKKEYVTIETTAINGNIQSTEEAFDSSQNDFFAVMPKVDFAWTPFVKTDSEGNEIGARFGFLSSLSTRFNANSSKYSHNFSIGPSMHPKWTTSNVLAAIQFEFIDFNDSNGTKDFEDIFFINFYVGIPILLK